MGNVADYASAVAKWVGGRVKDVREARGWTQEALASALTQAGHPISRVGVAKTESATRPVTIEDLAALAKTLEVPVTYFFVNGTTESTDEVNRLNDEWLASQATESSLVDISDKLTAAINEQREVSRRVAARLAALKPLRGES